LKKLATHLKGKVNVANVDCSGEGKAKFIEEFAFETELTIHHLSVSGSECQQYGINGFPTIQ
jgi:hypothetical protein